MTGYPNITLFIQKCDRRHFLYKTASKYATNYHGKTRNTTDNKQPVS